MTSGRTGGCRKWPVGVLLGITVVLLVFCSLPLLVERFVLPSIPVFSTDSPYRVNVARFGVGGATFYLSAKEAQGVVRSGMLRLHWSVSGLLKRRLDLVELDGLQIDLAAADQSGLKSQSPDEADSSSESFMPPLTVSELRLRNSTLLLARPQNLQALPFSATIKSIASDSGEKEPEYRLELDIAGFDLQSQLRWDPSGGRVFGQFKGGAGLAELVGLLPENETVIRNVSGRMELDGLFDVSLAPFRLSRLEAEILFPGAAVDVAGMALGTTPGMDPVLFVSGEGGAYKVEASGFQVNAPLVATAGLVGRLALSGKSPLWQGEMVLEVAAGPLADGLVEIPDGAVLHLSHLVRRTGQGAVTEAEVVLEDTSFVLVKQGIQFRNVGLTLPLAWPPQRGTKNGELKIGTILLPRGRLGSFDAQLRQQEDAVLLAGSLGSTMLPDDPVALNARLSPDPNLFAEVDFKLDRGRLDLRNLISLFPALETVTGTADVDISGALRLGSCGLDGELSLDLADGDFALEGGGLELADLRLALHVPSLKYLATDPAQLLQIGELRSGGLVLSDVRGRFRLESPDSLFVERIAGRWSGGRVFTSGFRLAREKQDLEVALICDRLELAGILSQLGLAEAEGDGRLSGRIPLRYRDREIFIDDGFLFTSPGEKGSLKVRQSSYLTDTISGGDGRLSPLNFAGAALADFEYNWAKLNIVSDEGDLLLKLQIDGKPKKRLPYRFDAGSNVFVQLPEGTKGGMDQPVRLDVNFRIPVNDLFRYQSQLMPLFRQFN